MDTNNNVFGWVVGIVAVLLIIAGIWWFAQSGATVPSEGTNATSTSQTATSTGQTGSTGGASAVMSEVRSGSTVNAIIASLSGASRFASLYTSTGVSASVTGKGPYTVFVPADSAFANLSPNALAGMSAAEKKRLVQYHVVAGKMLDLDAVSAGNHVALSKDSLNFQVQPQTKIAYVNSGYAITQYKASNGIVYVITAVLVPPQEVNPTTGTSGTPTP